LRVTSNIENGYLHPVHDLKSFPFLAIARLIYGELSDKQCRELKELAVLREQLWTYAMAGGLSRYSWSRYLPLSANNLLSKFETDWQRFNASAFERAKKLCGNAPIVEVWVASEMNKINKKEVG
jgi:gliotoxin/aspirochlorine/mycotoxins biosynthesis cytochrome P450 monooxygenase